MNKTSFALVGAAALALSACGGKGDDALGENVQANQENAAENLDAMAANTAEAEALGNSTDALNAEGASNQEADVNAQNSADANAAVNAM